MPPVVRRRMRYRKQYPGESEGITEEMRFVAMKLPNINGKKLSTNSNNFLLLMTMTVMVEMTIMPLPRTIARNRKPTATGVKRRLGGRAWKVLSSTWWTASSYSTPSSALSMNQTTSLMHILGRLDWRDGRVFREISNG